MSFKISIVLGRQEGAVRKASTDGKRVAHLICSMESPSARPETCRKTDARERHDPTLMEITTSNYDK